MAIGTPVEIGTVTNIVSNTSIVFTVGAAGVPAGMTLFIEAVFEGTDTNHLITDSKGNTYVPDVVPTDASLGINARRFRSSNNLALVQNDTITLSWTGNSVAEAMRPYYVDGLDVSSPLTGTPIGNEGNNSINDPADSGFLTTADNEAIILGFLGRRGFVADGFTEDADFTTLGSPVEANTGTASTSRVLHTAYRIVTTTETQNYAPTVGVGRNWSAGISAYKALTPLDQSASAGSSSAGTAAATPDVTITSAPQIMFGAVALNRSDIDVTQDQRFEVLIGVKTTGNSGSNIQLACGYRIVSAIETRGYDAFFPQNAGWAAGLVTYRALEDGGIPAPEITSPLTWEITEDAQVVYHCEATNSPLFFTATNLPAGLELATETGEITGSVATPDTYNLGLSATNESGSGPTVTLVLTVLAAAAQPPAGPMRLKPLPVAIRLALSNMPHGFGRDDQS